MGEIFASVLVVAVLLISGMSLVVTGSMADNGQNEKDISSEIISGEKCTESGVIKNVQKEDTTGDNSFDIPKSQQQNELNAPNTEMAKWKKMSLKREPEKASLLEESYSNLRDNPFTEKNALQEYGANTVDSKAQSLSTTGTETGSGNGVRSVGARPTISSTNAVTNPSFETGDFTGWITQDLSSPFEPLRVEGAGYSAGFGFFSTEPTDGNWVAYTGWDGNGPGNISLSQDVTLPTGTVIWEFDYRASWDLTYGATVNRTFWANIEPAGGGTPLQTNLILTAPANTTVYDTGNLSGLLNISAFAGTTVRLNFTWFVPENFAGPAQFQLDNIFVGDPSYRVKTSPETQSSFGDPTTSVWYNLVINNTGWKDDAYNLTVANNTWPTTIYDATGTTPISQISINANQSANITVKVDISPTANPGDYDIANITATSQNDTNVSDTSTLVTQVLAPILVVDDDSGLDTENWYFSALNANNYSYNYWDVQNWGSPDLNALQVHNVTIWFTGDNSGGAGGPGTPGDTLSPQERTVIENYLTGGGKMYVSSGGLGWDGFFNGWAPWINEEPNRSKLRLGASFDLIPIHPAFCG